MEDGKTPGTGWHWKITPEQIERLKAKDIETLNKVYFDNLEKFKRIGITFCLKARDFYFYDDFLNQVYVDLPFYHFENLSKFYMSLNTSFKRCRCFSRYEISIETPIDGTNELTLGDTVADGEDIADRTERAEAVEEFAPKFFNVVQKITGKDENDEELRELVEYVFTGYTYAQILRLARSGYAFRY